MQWKQLGKYIRKKGTKERVIEYNLGLQEITTGNCVV